LHLTDYEERRSSGPRWRRKKIEDELAEASIILQGIGNIAPHFNIFHIVSKSVAPSHYRASQKASNREATLHPNVGERPRAGAFGDFP